MHRKRLERHEGTGHARFLTFSCFRCLPLFGNNAIKQRFVDRFVASLLKTRVRALAWVIMPQHVHMIVQPDDGATVAAFLPYLRSRSPPRSFVAGASWTRPS